MSASYGARLRQSRERKGLTPEHLAIQFTRSVRTILRWETDEVLPPHNVRVLLAELLDLPIGEDEPEQLEDPVIAARVAALLEAAGQ